MVPFSVLDLSPITEGSDLGQELRNSLDLASSIGSMATKEISAPVPRATRLLSRRGAKR
jgi:hypothetical protein